LFWPFSGLGSRTLSFQQFFWINLLWYCFHWIGFFYFGAFLNREKLYCFFLARPIKWRRWLVTLVFSLPPAELTVETDLWWKREHWCRWSKTAHYSHHPRPTRRHGQKSSCIDPYWECFWNGTSLRSMPLDAPKMSFPAALSFFLRVTLGLGSHTFQKVHYSRYKLWRKRLHQSRPWRRNRRQSGSYWEFFGARFYIPSSVEIPRRGFDPRASSWN